MANYDDDYLGIGNPNHPANQKELSDRELLTEVHCVNSDVLEIFDNLDDLISYQYSQIQKYKTLVNEIKEMASISENGICVVIKNKIEKFLNK